MHRRKVTVIEQIETAKGCIEGRESQSEAAKRLHVDKTNIREWIKRYKAGGVLAFKELEHNTIYSAEIKQKAVTEYLSGKVSLRDITAKYGLRSKSQLRDWIKVYNSGKDFSHKMSGGSRMSTPRKTTQEERIAIAKDCLENGSNYGETAIKHNVSYQQVYTWVKKFLDLGEKGLEDRRGKRTEDQEPRTGIEELKIQIAKLEHENYILRMERDLLKKVEEYERRDAFRK